MIQIPVVTVTSGYAMESIIKEAIELHLGFKCVKSIDGIHINDKLISYNVYFEKVNMNNSDAVKEFVKQISNKLCITYENCKFDVLAQYYNL